MNEKSYDEFINAVFEQILEPYYRRAFELTYGESAVLNAWDPETGKGMLDE